MDGNFIFVGLKISEKLNDELEASKESMKPFFKDNNPDYLQIIQFDNNEYIGKAVESGVSLENLSNILMNVKTMLKMISPKFFYAEDTIRIYAQAPKLKRTYYF
ncbi:hypothetical protein JW935_27180 [candidate division KSB1 bacterium]|nr:hypothetical protein [candidate division KSB1 bacterium]